MTDRQNHTMPPGNRKRCSFMKSIVLLCLALMILSGNELFAQVISNTGAAVSLTTGVVVGSKDLENNAGIFGNNGTLNLSGNFFNSGSTNGNGLYNLIGNWTNNGSFTPGLSTVTLYGITNQTIIHGSSGETFYNLTINNPGRIITQIALPGSTLGVLKDLDLMAGTLNLGPTTSYLTIGGKAIITGSLIYNNATTQTSSVGDNLSGAGTIDMSAGALAHILNLAGAASNIGTFITNPASNSLVNYNGTINQTVFAAPNYRNLTISNSGIKTLQGSSIIGVNLNISGGTFDLGTTTTTLPILGSANIIGSLSFNGTSTKTVSLTGTLSGSGSIDMSGGNLSHFLYLTGLTNSIGAYSSGTGSTVNYNRNFDQTVFTSDDYRNLIISGTGVKTLLYGDVTAKGVLTMSAGDINANGNTLKVTNSAIAAIVRTNGKVIGKLQRAIGITGSDYLYPLGTSTVYNPLKMMFQSITPGPLTAQFKAEDIGTAGLPLDDNGNEIYERFTTGYWSLTAVAPMASTSYSVNLNYSGFTGVDLSSSIIKRTNGGNLEVDGVNGALTVSEINRNTLVNGISTTTTDLAIGKGRPKIDMQPSNIDICELFNAFFEVSARGRGVLTYQWQVNSGSGFSNIVNGGVYTGALSNKLIITSVPYTMNGYLYRCIITDSQGSSNITNTVLLTVNLIPLAVATPSSQNECPGVAFTNIVLTTSNNVTGTTFAWSRNAPEGITTTLLMSGPATGNQIPGTFTNTTDAPITVTFTIVPTGPSTTFCVGLPINAFVTVNPTPRVFTLPVSSIQCDSMTTSIQLTSPSTFTSGLVTFKYSVTTTGSVTGYSTSAGGTVNNFVITDKLVNQTDVYQIVTYRVVPISPVGCVNGPAQNATVIVNPTPRVIPVNLKPQICFGGTTQIVLTSPTVMYPGYGAMRFDYTVGVTGGPGIVTGSTATETNRLPGYTIAFPYQNYSDTLQSVYYSIRPKVDNAACVSGKIVVSETKVHPLGLQQLLLPKTLTCEGGSDATIRAVLGKGTKPMGVKWEGPFSYSRIYTTSKDTTEKKNLIGGIYTITITDNLGCVNSDQQFVSGARLDSYFQAIPKVTGYGTTCPESTDGELWIQETPSSTGIAPFKYKIVYNNTDTVISNTLTTTNVFQKYYNMPAGNYKLFIRDANGCYNTDYPEAPVVAPDVITVEFDKKTYQGGFNVSCKGYNDGRVAVKTITGGNGGYRYKWTTVNGTISGIDTLDFIDNIIAGTYYLKTTDIMGCIKMHSVTLTDPPGMLLANSILSLSPDNGTNISCNGGNDGSIQMFISGGSGNYTYTWSSPNWGTNTQATKDLTELKAGVYTCLVKDLNGCILTPSPAFTLTEPTALVLSTFPSTSADGAFNINCYGGTGSINVSVSGGSTGGYTYTWSTADGSGIVPGQNNQPALTVGTYHLVVRDANNCEIIKDITLTQPPAFSIQLSATNVTCQPPGFNNGSVDLTVTGGVGPFNYTWSNGSANEDLTGLTQGIYQVTVSYNNTCTKTASAQVYLPPPLTYTRSLSDYNQYNVSCFGLSNGSIDVTPTSGLAPFIYTWTGPNGFTATTEDISDIKAGQYTLNIRDNNYCTVTEVINVTEPGKLGMAFSLSSSLAGGFNLNCAGDSTGSIGVEPLNQVKTVDYMWADGIFGKTRMNLPAGTYDVIIKDANNCYASSAVTLTQPDSLKNQFEISKPFCPDQPDGSIQLNVTGGVKGADYYYKWGDNSTSNTLLNIAKGFYKVSISDMNGCSISDSVNVEPLNETCLQIPNVISPNGDMINDVLNIGKIELYPLMEVKLFNRWGEIIWRSEKGYPQPWDGRSNGARLPVDSYHYIIDLHNGTKPLIGNVTIVR